MQELYVVILAGGSGTRFWPRSRLKTPKQLCALGSELETMLETTLKRAKMLTPAANQVIVTHIDQRDKTAKVSQKFGTRILVEPAARNTAPALTMAAIDIHARSPQAIMVSLHADHVIRDEKKFTETMQKAIAFAEKNSAITLIGIKPLYAETGYGYIEAGDVADAPSGVVKVKSFREKPDAKTAEGFLKTGKYFWNAGLFVLPVARIVAELKKHLPQTFEKLSALHKEHGGFERVPAEIMQEVYTSLETIAIDHAVFEKAGNLFAVSADIGWQDMGSWDALPKCFGTNEQGNYLQGDVLAIDSKNIIMDSDGPFVAALGVEDLVIVASKDAVFVCPKNRSQDARKIVEELKKRGRTELI